MLPIIRKLKYSDWIIDVLFLSSTLLVFYLLWLGKYPLFSPDEGRYAEAAREMVTTGDYITPRVNGVAFLDKPILYYWLQAIAIHLFGLKEWALRLFPALLGIFGCLITYICGRHLFDRRSALLAALILATTPLYFGGAHYANLDLEVAVFISASLLCFITGIIKNNQNPAFIFCAWIFVALAFLTKGLIALAFPAIIGGLWILLTQRFNVLKKIHIILGLFIFICLVIPWYVLVQKANPQFLHYFFVTQQVTRFLSKAEFNNKNAFWFYLPVIVLSFFPWTVFLLGSIKQSLQHVLENKQKYAAELFLLLWATTVLIFFSIPHSKIVTYILPIFPPLALLTGHYTATYWKEARENQVKSTSIFFAGFACCLAVFLFYTSHHFNLSKYFLPYLYIISGILLLSAMASLILINATHFRYLILISIVSSCALLLTLTIGAIHLNHTTTKPLATHLRSIIKPEDEVIAYYKYYQDLPLYLERQITIVSDWDAKTIIKKDNWLREMWLGKRFQESTNWLINEETFWQRYNSDKRIFVFLNENYFEQFKKQATYYFYITKHHDIILLSNQPTFLTATMRSNFIKMQALQRDS